MLKIGLTGSIGMGKSTAAKLFADAGIPVNDSDAVVHDLYAGEAAPLVNAAFPGTMKDGAVDRLELGRQLAVDPAGFKRLEAIVHPLVRKRETEFLKRQRAAGADMVLLDIHYFSKPAPRQEWMLSSSSALIHRFNAKGCLRAKA